MEKEEKKTKNSGIVKRTLSSHIVNEEAVKEQKKKHAVFIRGASRSVRT